MLFLYALFVWGLSWVLSVVSFDYHHPLTGDVIQVVNMLSPDELTTFVTLMVKNFISFPPSGHHHRH